MDYYIGSAELAKLLNCSTANAYKAIREMNDELAREGFRVFPGRIPKAYLQKKYYGLDEEVFENGRSENNSQKDIS